MKKALITAIGLGAAYLYKNPQARQMLMNKFQSVINRPKSTSETTQTAQPRNLST